MAKMCCSGTLRDSGIRTHGGRERNAHWRQVGNGASEDAAAATVTAALVMRPNRRHGTEAANAGATWRAETLPEEHQEAAVERCAN